MGKQREVIFGNVKIINVLLRVTGCNRQDSLNQHPALAFGRVSSSFCPAKIMHWLNTKSAARPAGDKAFGNQLLVGQLNGSGADIQLSGQAADGRQACIRRQCAAENLFLK